MFNDRKRFGGPERDASRAGARKSDGRLRDLLASPCGWLVRVLTIEGSIDELRAAFALLPTVRLRHVILRQQSALEDEVKRELAPEIMTMLNHNVDVDIGFWAPEKLRWKR